MTSIYDLLRGHFALRAKRKQKARAFGMTSWREQHWLRSYAAKTYQGRGAIVDLGCFVGATTIALAEGLVFNPKRQPKQIHAYDLFTWSEDFELWSKGKEVEGLFPVDGTFLPEFLRRTDPWRDYVVAHPEDLTHARWQNGPIEFLLVDAMKSAEITSGILRGFFPHLIAGLSYVAQQDFSHCYTPWVHLVAFRLRDYFSVAADLESSGTTVFRCDKNLPASALHMNVSFAACDTGEIEAAFDHSFGLVPDQKKGNIIAAKAMAYRERGDLNRARDILASTPDDMSSLAGELDLIKNLLLRG